MTARRPGQASEWETVPIGEYDICNAAVDAACARYETSHSFADLTAWLDALEHMEHMMDRAAESAYSHSDGAHTENGKPAPLLTVRDICAECISPVPGLPLHPQTVRAAIYAARRGKPGLTPVARVGRIMQFTRQDVDARRARAAKWHNRKEKKS